MELMIVHNVEKGFRVVMKNAFGYWKKVSMDFQTEEQAKKRLKMIQMGFPIKA